MEKISLEIIIPVYNEGDNIIKVLESLNKFVKTEFRVLICYDDEQDDVFMFEEKFKKFPFQILFVKNPGQGPCSAIKQGLYYGNSDCVIVYPADDFLNFNITIFSID